MRAIDTINWRRWKLKFQNLNLWNLFGKKLSTTPTTTAIVSDEIEETTILSDNVIKKYINHEEEMDIKLNPKICCPELVGTNLTVDATSTNYKCGKLVATAPKKRIVTCLNCNNTMKVKNVSTSSVVCYYLKICRQM